MAAELMAEEHRARHLPMKSRVLLKSAVQAARAPTSDAIRKKHLCFFKKKHVFFSHKKLGLQKKKTLKKCFEILI